MDHETWCDMMVSDFPAPSDHAGSCRPTICANIIMHNSAMIAALRARSRARCLGMAPPDDSAGGAGPGRQSVLVISHHGLLAAISKP